MKRKRIVAGNWKMNCDISEAMKLASEVSNMYKDEIRSDVEVVIAPSFVLIPAVKKMIDGSGIFLAAQNCADQVSGAYTGEVSAGMLRSAGVDRVILGHSERRSHYAETDDMLARKIERAFEAGLDVIFCIGESMQERESGIHPEIVRKQLENSLFKVDGVNAANTVIAYEPVWAIGTGLNATAAQAQEMHEAIRGLLTEKFGNASADFTLLYGGSCNENNAGELFAMNDVDGGLIGGASLKPRSFIEIIRSLGDTA
jgi:triosephosphate isomerase